VNRGYGVSYEGGMVTLLRDHGLPTGENLVTQQRDQATPLRVTPYNRGCLSLEVGLKSDMLSP